MSKKIEIETKEAAVVTITDCEEVRHQIKVSMLDLFFMTAPDNKIVICFTHREEAAQFVALFDNAQIQGELLWEKAHTTTTVLKV